MKNFYFKSMFSLLLVLLICAFLPMTAKAAADKDVVTRIILVRHGETSYNKEGRFQGALDIPLNEEGLHQADLLAESMKDVPIDVFITSPMERAYITTKKCSDLQGKEIAYADYRLKEASYGDWAGKVKSEIAKEYPKESKIFKETRWKFTPPNGESLKSIQKRYREVLDDVVKRYPGKTVFIGAHSAGNAAVLCSVMNIGIEHYNQIKQDNTCVNVLEYKNGKWSVVLINSVSHLGYLYKGEKKAA